MVLLPDAATYLESARDVIFAYLFGSLAEGEPQPLSDVDIAVYLKEDSDVVDTKMTILGELIDRLQTDEIDLVVLNTAPIALQMSIIESKRIIVDKEPFTRHNFESLVMRKYLDFSYMESGILRRKYYG